MGRPRTLMMMVCVILECNQFQCVLSYSLLIAAIYNLQQASAVCALRLLIEMMVTFSFEHL